MVISGEQVSGEQMSGDKCPTTFGVIDVGGPLVRRRFVNKRLKLTDCAGDRLVGGPCQLRGPAASSSFSSNLRLTKCLFTVHELN